MADVTTSSLPVLKVVFFTINAHRDPAACRESAGSSLRVEILTCEHVTLNQVTALEVFQAATAYTF